MKIDLTSAVYAAAALAENKRADGSVNWDFVDADVCMDRDDDLSDAATVEAYNAAFDAAAEAWILDPANREAKYSDEEFAKLERNADGDIVNDLEMVCVWLTPTQIERLSGDDQSRADGYAEDMRCMLAEFL